MKAGRLPIAGNRNSLIIALVFAVLSISLYSPLMLWVLLLALCAVTVRVALYLGWYHHAPNHRTVNLLAILSASTLAWFSSELGFLLSMVNLLVMACSLKLMLLKNRRDFLQLFICGLFILGCGYIFTQTLFSALFYLAVLVALLIAQFGAYAPRMPLKQQLRQLLTLCVQASPIALVLFIVLPKLPPMWQMPAAKSAATGLSEKVTPGDIARLSQSSDLVFNATFNNALPDMKDRYWRALTLEHFDGKSWQVSPLRKNTREKQQWMNMEFAPAVSGPAYQYQVIAEPSGQRWLYAMDLAVPGDSASRAAIWQSNDYLLIAHQPLMSKWAYQVNSYPHVPLNQASFPFDQRINLQLPDNGNPKTRQWVSQLRQRYPEDGALLNALMDHFANAGFRYTLEPPVMPIDPVDTFLFEHKSGFCSHYASAMAYALRLAGIPARMVTGYHGGSLLTDQVLSVHQYDAHAWIEAHLGDSGWVRFDPTSVVAPARIRFGLEQAINESGESYTRNPFYGLKQFALLAELNHLFANIDYLWSRWVLGFNANRQQDLFQWLLGSLTPLRLTLLFLAVLALIAGLLALYFLPGWRKPARPKHVRLYQQAEVLVSTHTGQARNNQPVGAYCAKVSPLLPETAAQQFKTLCNAFEVIEYKSSPPNTSALLAMRRAQKKLFRALKHSHSSVA
ncbi:DUF3488 domain-containing protein [Alteromonas aestuariivivens]|uniref:DUF3488 domain-containing protein n=1 Tax=Alteromonas aestuariivivens TaxID=1938339 RepID=A0A3D8MB10_9ALTE|nr:DUF3488 and transglutaminase-like domain-containing protein [Alteromonas aestuariivivens]RDV27564.1 DUF3488 domain-containing protein [Alteromonas aestuariivivens]